jgi:hypothetical protein
MLHPKLQEIADELRSVVFGRSGLADALIPPVLFLIINAALGLQAALWGSLAIAAVVAGVRLARRQSLGYALGGVAGVAFALLLAWLAGGAQGYFLPGLINGALSVAICVISIVAKRPLVAYTSFVARRWPLDWYWHPRVRPAYSEVTWLWAMLLAARLGLQAALYQAGAVQALAVVGFITGWPATIVLLIASYLYGTWRLRRLGGPGIEEFKAGAPPPWKGQARGF